MPNILSKFWQELMGRKVYKVFALCAAKAFFIMEAATIKLPRLGLPDWTVTFQIILLIVGFPTTIILSCKFDITPEGARKTLQQAWELKAQCDHDHYILLQEVDQTLSLQ